MEEGFEKLMDSSGNCVNCGKEVAVEVGLMASNHWPDEQMASFIYDSESLCEDCFEKT